MNLLPRSLGLSAVVLLLTTHPLPAPIQEVPESPAPTPEQRAKLKRTPSKSKAVEPEAKTKSETKPSATSSAKGPKFAGTWTGHVDVPGCGGDQQCSVTIDAAEKFISGTFEQKECSRFEAVPTMNLNVMTWKFDLHDGFLDYDATLTLIGDGQTATYTLVQRHWYTGSGIVTRSSSTTDRSSTGTAAQLKPRATTSTASVAQIEFPIANPVPGKPGFVYSPFASNSTILLDVRGKPSGTKIKDPTSGKLFIIP